MMPFLALPLALVLPALFGWAALRLVEGRHPVLFNGERWVMGGLLGLTFLMFVQFLLEASVHLPFTFLSFAAVQTVSTLTVGVLWFRKRSTLPPSPVPHESAPLPRRLAVLLGLLLTWSGLKAMLVGTVFLLLTPSYLQDTLSNWNMRGKLLYETKTLTLVLPNEDPTLSPKGVSSYPPTVPMAKVWVSDIAGEWNEAAVNAVHFAWYLCALALGYFALRRYVHNGWALLGLYVMLSLPLYLMHGTNAYADAFVSAHVCAAVGLLLHASRGEDEETSASFLRLAAIAGGLLAFTKNEGLLLFLPPFLLSLFLTLWILRRRTVVSKKRMLRLGMFALIAIGCIAGPWLLFKWSHGLTFGNGKPFTSLGFSWQHNVLFAVIVNTFSEGNWLLLFPLFFSLVLWRRRQAFGALLVPMTFFLIVYFGQMLLYLFTALSREALLQTGYARGLIQLMPVIVLLTMLLLFDARERITEGLKELRVMLRGS